jgi:hypothetical protein
MENTQSRLDRHSVGGKMAGDTNLWECCNLDTSADGCSFPALACSFESIKQRARCGECLLRDLTFWSARNVGAGEARLPFDVAPAPSSLSAVTSTTSPIFKLRGAGDQRQAKRDSLADIWWRCLSPTTMRPHGPRDNLTSLVEGSAAASG